MFASLHNRTYYISFTCYMILRYIYFLSETFWVFFLNFSLLDEVILIIFSFVLLVFLTCLYVEQIIQDVKTAGKEQGEEKKGKSSKAQKKEAAETKTDPKEGEDAKEAKKVEIAEDIKTQPAKDKKAKKIKRHKGKSDNQEDIQRMEDDPGDTQVSSEIMEDIPKDS